MALFSFFSRKQKKETLDRGLEKTKQGLLSRLHRAIAARSTIDDDFLDDLEEILITSDVGTDTTLKIIDRVKARVARDKYLGTAELNNILCDEICSLLRKNTNNTNSDSEEDATSDFLLPSDAPRPYVVMVVGVNGAGKTTTIGKLAHLWASRGYKVLVGAADTFRAAAVEQLQEWTRRAQVDIVKQQTGSDPAAVAYDTVSKAVAGGYDIAIIDTAGRLHTKRPLMDELAKVERVMNKVIPGAPHEVLLVLDGSTGQNAYEQARQFSAATTVTGLAITKLDGTARGGVVIGISDMLQVPVRYIGLGEGITDLQTFDPETFVRGIFS